MDCWRQIDGRIYLTSWETARRLGVTRNALEVAKSNLKKDKDSKKRRYKDLFDFAVEDEGRTWFLEDGVEFFIEKLQAKVNLQYKISLIISEMSDKMGLTAEEIASALGMSESFTYRILKNKDLPSYELCKTIMCRIIEILNYAPYTGGDWNTGRYSSQYNNDVSYFDRIGVGYDEKIDYTR